MLIFELGPCHSPSLQCTVAGFLASCICSYSSSVCFWASRSHFLSRFSLPLFLPVHLVITILMLLISSSQWSCTVSFLLLSCFFFCLFRTLSLNIFLFLSLFTYSSVTRSRSSPSPVYVLLSFIFLHLITVTPHPPSALLVVLHHPSCMWILTQRWFFFALEWNLALFHSFWQSCSFQCFMIWLTLHSYNW